MHVYSDTGIELPSSALADRLVELLGPKLQEMIAEYVRTLPDPDVDSEKLASDVNNETHGRITGAWRVNRYNAPVEYYAHKIANNVGYGVNVSENDWSNSVIHTYDDTTRIAADEALKRNHHAEITDLPLEVYNLLTTQGASTLWHQAANDGATNSGSASPAVTAWYSNAQAVIGVGDSSTSASASQYDLQAGTNRLWVAQDATFPTLPATSVASFILRSTFGSTQGNYVWNELACANDGGSNVTIPGSAARSASYGTMLDRVVSALGTKTAGTTWQPTFTLSLA